MSDFIQFVRDAGLMPGQIAADGRWRRCKTVDKPKRKNGAYKLASDGLVGWVQNHGVHDAPLMWRPDGGDSRRYTPPPIDRAEIRRQREKERADRRAAIEGARAYYSRCAPLIGGHEYLRRKQLDMTGCCGLRVDRPGRLVVPMERGGSLVSVQRIQRDGDKRFWPGAPTSGTMYVLERPSATMTVLCEGLATGLAIAAAVRGARVVVAFTASNLPKVAAKMAKRGMVVVAADFDHQTVCQGHRREGITTPFDPRDDRPEWCRCNPGLTSAMEAADILRCGVAIPEGIQGTDFCDLRVERVEELMSRKVYGRRPPTEGSIRRDVDAVIARTMMRHAQFLSAAS